MMQHNSEIDVRVAGPNMGHVLMHLEFLAKPNAGLSPEYKLEIRALTSMSRSIQQCRRGHMLKMRMYARYLLFMQMPMSGVSSAKSKATLSISLMPMFALAPNLMSEATFIGD